MASKGGSVEDEAAAVSIAVRNAVDKDFRLAALHPMMAMALAAIAEHEGELYAKNVDFCHSMVCMKLNALEQRCPDHFDASQSP